MSESKFTINQLLYSDRGQVVFKWEWYWLLECKRETPVILGIVYSDMEDGYTDISIGKNVLKGTYNINALC